MSGVLKIALAIILGLGAVAASVFGMADRHVLTAPPERELEGLLVMLANKRYTQAGSLLTEELRTTPADSLRAIHDGIERRIGEIEKVATDREWMTDQRASAIGRMTSMDHRTVHFRVPLVLERGTWKVADLRPLSDAAR